MRPVELFLHARWRALWIAAVCGAALAAAFACSSGPSDVHESDEVKGKACVSCHEGAYSAARNPLHVGQMPQTCQDCHETRAWAPSTAKDHRWWPIQNKHVGVSCVACHTKGFNVGDTPKDCLGCHRKSYESAQSPKHAANGVDQYPLDCTLCHADTGFKPSAYKHSWELVGRHFIAPCAGCHTGTPPKYKGTATDCYQCHKDDAENRVVPMKPDHNSNHKTYPHTCLDCHLMSGWVQGPPLRGPHPEAKFPITMGKHADKRIRCLDCHNIVASDNPVQNTDCVHCHLGSHVSPAVDALHIRDGGTVAGYPLGASTTNFCTNTACHTSGQRL